jgi:hypothetical protein
VTRRVAALVQMRLNDDETDWIFPARTNSGTINQSSIKRQHLRALKDSGVAPFVPYDLRHTCLKRWARYLDPLTLKKLAGHESLETTMKYIIHLNQAESEARGSFGSSNRIARRLLVGIVLGIVTWLRQNDADGEAENPNNMNEIWCARRGSNPRPNDSKSFALSN